jgi:hypothetical protein
LKAFDRGDDIFANAVIVGFHADSPDPLIQIAAAVVDNLNEWCNINTITSGHSEDGRGTSASYLQPAPLKADEDDKMSLSIRSSLTKSHSRWRVSIANEMRFELTAKAPQPLSVFLRRFHACQDLLSILSAAVCTLTAVRLIPAFDEKAVGEYHAVQIFRKSRDSHPSFLFQQSDVSTRLPEVFGKWLRQAERLTAARALYMSATHGDSFLELKVLYLAQAAEAYHRRAHSGRGLYMDPDAYKNTVLPELLKAIPSNISQDHHRSLSKRLEFGNEVSFRKRLTMLFSDHERVLSIVVPKPRQWIERIVACRNNFTHHPEVSVKPELDTMPLHQFKVILSTLLEQCFLEAMSFDAAQRWAASENFDRYHQLRAHFFEPEN